ncbi:hypothetical protein BD311DRAFT_318261 [Dichomitus squalens]|uniref:Uncharacterized protein n=1 Tax=Dichomitus squalens TaxID=114155 RepID=A0A4Q9MLY2_9APHY|nr:hypothetical protein BD311DRAFT_318261 [Dichomitus squalens]
MRSCSTYSILVSEARQLPGSEPGGQSTVDGPQKTPQLAGSGRNTRIATRWALVGLCSSQNSDSIALSESNPPSQSASHLCSPQRSSAASFQIKPNPHTQVYVLPTGRPPRPLPLPSRHGVVADSAGPCGFPFTLYRCIVGRAPCSCSSAGYPPRRPARSSRLRCSFIYLPITSAFAARPAHGPAVLVSLGSCCEPGRAHGDGVRFQPSQASTCCILYSCAHTQHQHLSPARPISCARDIGDIFPIRPFPELIDRSPY